MNPETEAVLANIFPAARESISDWAAFPWHRDSRGRIQAHKPHSSQSLAIDVFGTISNRADKDHVLGAVARSIGLPAAGPWEIRLEWSDPDNLLKEKRQTQVDAAAFSPDATILFECKFTETGGSCSQTNRIATGPHKGETQCNGTYSLQENPVTGTTARCALTGKGIRYWEFIGNLYDLSADADHKPCPFRRENFQWMRNSALAAALSKDKEIETRVVAAYADADSLPTAKKARAGKIGYEITSPSNQVIPISYQDILTMAATAVSDPVWSELSQWVARKIAYATDVRC